MKKAFDSVQMMRDIREGLSRRYVGKPDLELKELRAARKRFEARQAAACTPHVAVTTSAYVSQATLRMLDASVANLKRGLASEPIDLSALAEESTPPPRPKAKRRGRT